LVDLKFAIMGAGNGGHAMAADLTLAGFEVRLFELERFKANLEPIWEKGGIETSGISISPERSGFAKVSMVTTKIEEALEGVDVICLPVPAYGHMTHIENFVPHLEDGQMVITWPDNWASIRIKKYMKDKGIKKNVVIGGTASLIYATRLIGPAKSWIRRIKASLPVAAYPNRDTPKVVEILDKAYPGRIKAGANILEVTMANWNWIEHPPLMIFNAARIESNKGDFDFWKEGGEDPSYGVKSPAKLVHALEGERTKVMEAFDLDPNVAKDDYPPGHPRAYLSEEEKEAIAKIKIPGVLQAHPDKAPTTLNFRYLTEDVPYGLVALSTFGDLAGIPTRNIDAVVNIASTILDKDYWKEGITPEKLGFGGLSAVQIYKIVST